MKILVIMTAGRSGSDLFQSLLDGHSAILQFPGILNFDKKLLNLLYEDNSEIIAENFYKSNLHFFDSRLQKIERHHQLGVRKNSYFSVQKNRFIKEFMKLQKKNNTKLNKLKNLHLAYVKAAGLSSKSKKILVLHLHVIEYLKNFCKIINKDNNIKFILTVRDPLVSLCSTMKNWLRYQKGIALDPGSLYWNVDVHINIYKYLRKFNKKIYIIQLELLHKKNLKVMKDFCKIFRIKYKKCLKKSTYFGKKWWGDKTSGKYLDGINPKFQNTFSNKYFFEKDLEILEYKLRNIIKYYNYPFRSKPKKRKFLEFLPFKFELITWGHAMFSIKSKRSLLFIFYWLKRLIITFTDNQYDDFNFPYSIGSKN